MFQHLERSRVQLPLVLLGFAVALVSILVYTEGHLVAPLDDTYIYLQYARQLANGHGLSYSPGQPPTSGATSLLWCVLLTPPFVLGFGGEWGVLWAQTLSFALFFACLRFGVVLLRRRVDDPWRGVGVLLLLTSGPMYWAAASGMETMLYAALLLAALERFDRFLGKGRARGLLVALFFLPLARPEGLAASLIIGCGLWWHDGTRRGARFLLPGLGAILFSGLGRFALTGNAIGSGLGAKSYFYIPHVTSSEALRVVTGRFVSFLYDSMIFLDGGVSMAFLTVPGGLLLAFAGMLGGKRGENQTFYMVCDAVFTVGMAIPFVLDSVDHNHYRYHQALVPGLLVFVTIGLFEVWESIPKPGLRKAMLGFLVLFHLFGWRRWLFQLGVDSSEIFHQHIRMARWIDANLPAETLPAMNDAGVLPYYTGRRFLDMVGLTTGGASPSFLRGTGSTFEWLDRRAEKPTHFCGHTRWWRGFQGAGVVKPALFEASLRTYESAAGAQLLLAPFDEAAWGTGDRPCAGLPRGFELVDGFDVAHAPEEEIRGYTVRFRDERGEVSAILASGREDGCGWVVEGGYPVSGHEGFRARGLTPGRPALVLARYQAPRPTRVQLFVDGQPAAGVDLPGREGWTLARFEVPAALVTRPDPWLEVEDLGTSHYSFHYWVAQPKASAGGSP